MRGIDVILDEQERKQYEAIRYRMFKAELEEEFTEEGIESFWAILETRCVWDWHQRLIDELGEMDKEDRHWIIEVYDRIPD